MQCLDELFEQIIYYSAGYPDFAKKNRSLVDAQES